jgi:hypothetical protein
MVERSDGGGLTQGDPRPDTNSWFSENSSILNNNAMARTLLWTISFYLMLQNLATTPHTV